MAPSAYTGAVLDVTSGKWWVRGGLANVNTRAQLLGQQAAGADLPRRLLQGRVQRLRLQRRARQDGQLRRQRRHLLRRHRRGRRRSRRPDPTRTRPSPAPARTPWPTCSRSTPTSSAATGRFFGQASFGQQKGAAIFNSDGVLRDASWWGLSGTAAYKITPRLEGVLRADYVDNSKNGGGLLGFSFDDPINGIGRGLLDDGSFAKGESVGANRWAISLGMNYLFDENTIFKLEYRYDGADQPVFEYRRATARFEQVEQRLRRLGGGRASDGSATQVAGRGPACRLTAGRRPALHLSGRPHEHRRTELARTRRRAAHRRPRRHRRPAPRCRLGRDLRLRLAHRRPRARRRGARRAADIDAAVASARAAFDDAPLVPASRRPCARNCCSASPRRSWPRATNWRCWRRWTWASRSSIRWPSTCPAPRAASPGMPRRWTRSTTRSRPPGPTRWR